MVMETGKRKREEDNGVEGEKRGEKAKREGEGPSNEEVEEFFAILRRMHAAVKYFDRKGKGKGWRTVLETEVVMLPEPESLADEKDTAAQDGLLDLNTPPEESHA